MNTTPATDHPVRHPCLPDARRRLAALVGLTALALATAACAGGDDPERAGAESIALDVDAPPETTAGDGVAGDEAPGGDESADESVDESADESADESGDSSGQGSSLEPSSADTPEDQDLDIELRHPGGATLRVTRLAFEGNDIAVDMEFINGSREDVTLTQTRFVSERLRLVDDAGETYNFIYPDEDGAAIELAPGDSLEGTLRFRGPLYDRPDQLNLVTNLSDDEIAAYDLDEQRDSTPYPAFVVPLDLVWE